MPALRAIVYRFYAYRLLVANGFVFPVLTLYLLARGVSLSGVGLAGGAFFAGRLVGEIPTGYVADRIGRRNGLLVGCLVVAASHLGFALSSTLPAFVASWGLWGVGTTFRSGSADAWLYDVLDERDATDAFTRVRGRGSSAYLVSAACTSLVGGLLYEHEHTLPFLVAAGSTVVAGAVVLTLPAAGAATDDERFTFAEARAALGTIAADPTLRRFVPLAAVVLAVPETAEVFVQPVATAVGLRPATLGPLYAVLMATAAGASAVADRVEDVLGVARWFAIGPVLLAGSFALGVAVPGALALHAFAVSRGFDAVTATLGSSYVNDRIESRGRATTLSAASMVYALTFVGARTAGGALADATTPLVALTVFGAAAVCVAWTARGVANPFDAPEGKASGATAGE